MLNCETCGHSCHCSNGSRCSSCQCYNCVHDKQKTQKYYDSLAEEYKQI
jgi:hypothetical protein